MKVIIPELTIEWKDEVAVARHREELARELNAYWMHLSPGLEGYRYIERGITSYACITTPPLGVHEYALYCLHLPEYRIDVPILDEKIVDEEDLQDDVCWFLQKFSNTNPPKDVLKRYIAMRQTCAFGFFELRYSAEEAVLFGAGPAGVFLLARWARAGELASPEEISARCGNQRTFATQVSYRFYQQFLSAGYSFERLKK